MSKVLGYIIGAIFVLGVLTGPALGLYLVSKDSLVAMSFQTVKKGVIEKCHSTLIPGSSSKRRHNIPKVKIEDGSYLSGTVSYPKYIYTCHNSIGKEVEVLIDSGNTGKKKINTFIEMWFLPAILLGVCLVWYPICIIGYAKKLSSKSV